jgi:hypothetical protein
MLVYLGRDRKHATATVITVYGTMPRLTTGTENLGPKLHGQFFLFF